MAGPFLFSHHTRNIHWLSIILMTAHQLFKGLWSILNPNLWDHILSLKRCTNLIFNMVTVIRYKTRFTPQHNVWHIEKGLLINYVYYSHVPIPQSQRSCILSTVCVGIHVCIASNKFFKYDFMSFLCSCQ